MAERNFSCHSPREALFRATCKYGEDGHLCNNESVVRHASHINSDKRWGKKVDSRFAHFCCDSRDCCFKEILGGIQYCVLVQLLQTLRLDKGREKKS